MLVPDVSLRFRFDKGFAIDAWLALYHAAGYNRDWTGPNAEAMRAHAYLVVTVWQSLRPGSGHARRPGSGQAETMIGTLTVLSDGLNYALIEDVVVHPAWRRQGIGSTLVRYALDRLRAMPPGVVQLHAVPGAEDFYARLGFVASGGTLMYLTR